MLGLYLLKSLTPAAHAVVTLRASQYTVDGRVCGPLLLKLLITLGYVDVGATTKHFREQLRLLPDFTQTASHNVLIINDRYRSILENLAYRGVNPEEQELSDTLFRTYLAVKDKTFHKYIGDKETAHDEGNHIRSAALLQMAEVKYNNLILKDLWRAPTAEDEQIIALTAEVKALTQAQYKAKTKSKTPAKPKDKDGRQSSIPAWKLVPPGENESKAMKKNGKDYYWCPYHYDAGMWCVHTVKECSTRIKLLEKGEDQREDMNDADKLRLTHAIASIAEYVDGSDDDEE